MFKINIYDEDFDFFDSELPEHNHLKFAFGDQLARARTLLKERSREEINYIIESLDWMLKEGSQLLEKEALRPENDEFFINRVKALKFLMDAGEFDINNQTNLKNATWTDYFATLALITVLESLHPGNFPEPIFQDYDYPMEAMEAVCIAEFQKELALQDKQNLRIRGSKGGMVRAEKFGILRTKILAEYEANPRLQSQSNRQAARILVKEFKDDIANTLSNAEPRETIERWIGKYKKKYSNSA